MISLKELSKLLVSVVFFYSGGLASENQENTENYYSISQPQSTSSSQNTKPKLLNQKSSSQTQSSSNNSKQTLLTDHFKFNLNNSAPSVRKKLGEISEPKETKSNSQNTPKAKRKADSQKTGPRTKVTYQMTIEAKPRDKHSLDFEAILKRGPKTIGTSTPFKKITQINKDDELKDGSRRWVQFISMPNPLNFRPLQMNQNSHDWHKRSKVLLNAIRSKVANYHKNNKDTHKKLLPKWTNFALARLTIVTQQNEFKEIPLPYFFVSGWPGNGNMDSIQQLADDLKNQKLEDETLKSHSHYQLMFLSQSYEGGREPQLTLKNRHYSQFSRPLKETFNKEINRTDRLLGENRLNTHVELINKADTNNRTLETLYFHGEQAVRIFLIKILKSYKQPINYAVADICTYYDMCWCCGDSLTSCSHNNEFGVELLFNVSGCTRPTNGEQPFLTNLWQQRTEFPNYENGQAYEFRRNPQTNQTVSYKPLIAHADVEDLI